MAKASPRQRKSIGRVMHEYKHGELKSGPNGKGGKVKSRRQAIAIALHEGGASKYESETENKRDFSRTKAKERRGETGQQEREGKSHVGARGRLESSRAMGGENATRTTSRKRKSSGSRKRKESAGKRSSSRASSTRKSSATRKASGGRKSTRKSSRKKKTRR
ncbi:MAG: DUF6496 domain-containing protein [Rhizomicrobium sp.]|jgi:hypothetical protein